MKKGKSRLLRIITIPIRALGKARDMYVRGMNTAERRGYGSGMAGPLSALPKSFSARPATCRASESERDDYAELVRAASARTYGSRLDVEAVISATKIGHSATVDKKGLAKCSSVGMGKIDEDRACEDFDGDCFGGGDKNKSNKGLLYPRSKSYAVAKRSVVF